jgi:hypothetical protein
VRFHLRPWLRPSLLVILVFLSAGARAGAESLSSFLLAALGGVGGSTDVKPGQGYGNPGFEVDFGHFADPQTLVAVHAGQLNFSSKPSFGALTNAKLSYADIGAEYRFQESYYESGIYLGLGAYRLSGNAAGGGSSAQTAVGGALGITGEFRFNRSLGLLIELSGHYVDFRSQRVFVMAEAGVALHF